MTPNKNKNLTLEEIQAITNDTVTQRMTPYSARAAKIYQKLINGKFRVVDRNRVAIRLVHPTLIGFITSEDRDIIRQELHQYNLYLEDVDGGFCYFDYIIDISPNAARRSF